MMSSCSLYNALFGKSTVDEPAKITAPTAKIDKKKDKKKDKKQEQADDKSKPGRMPSTDQLLGAQWNIVGVNELVINAEDDTPYINFGKDGRFYASDGCNVLNGDYVLRSDGKITFSAVLSTMKFCPDVEFAPAVGQLLSDDKSYNVDCQKIGQETYLYLKDKKGRTVATLRRHNMEFLNGNWRVTNVEGKNIDDSEMTVFLDIPELKIHGNTGCNFFNGDIYIDPSRSNSIDFSNMALTRMACPKADRERAMMVALEEARSAIAGNDDNTVMLIDGKGKQLMKLERIPIEK